MNNSNNFFQLVAEFQKNIDLLNQVLKGTLNDGVLVDGVVKPSISKAINDAFIAINAQISGRQAFQTHADLIASGAPPADKLLAEVWNDGDKNGLYGFTGSAWQRSDYDLYNKVQRLSSSQANAWYQDLGPAAPRDENQRTAIISAIKDVRGNKLINPGSMHYLWIMASNDPSYNDRLYWRDDKEERYLLSPETRPAGWESGPIWVRCNHSTDWDSYLDVLIDYRQLPDGLLWNGSANALGISNAWLNFGYLFHAQHNQVQLHKGSVYPDLTKFLPSERYERQWMPFIESHSFNVKDVAHPYVLETLAIDHSKYGNRMAIRDGKGRYYANDNGKLNVVEGALHRFRCFGDGGYIDVMVNVDAIKAVSHLPTLLWNRNDPWILFTANEGCNSGSRLLTLLFDLPMIDVNESKLTTQTIMDVGKSVKSAEVILGDNLAVDDLYIQVFTKSPSDFNDSIWLCTKDKTVGTWVGVASTTAPTEIEVTGTQSGQLVTVKMVIDWTQIETSGVLINGVPSAAPLALKEDKAAKAVTKHEESFHFPQWLDLSARNHANWNSFASFLALQVKGFHLGNTKDGVIYGIGIITKNSVQYGTGVSIFDNEKRIVASGRVDMANPDGETVFELMPVGDGPKGKLWLDMTQMEDGTVENRNQPRLLLNPEYVEIRVIPDMVKPAPDTRVNQYVRNAVRLACMGSSITWGSGYVGQSSFVGVIEDYLRQTCATTLLGYDLASMTRLSEAMQYKGAVGMMEGAGNKTEANLHGDEVSLAICKERGNIHAAVVEMWVNGALHTRFSTYNEEPYQENVAKSFTGDGSIRSWDLGQAFTFNHRVTKDRATLTGGIYNGGYGGSWPDGWEYMVVRKVSESGSEHQVTHWLTFKTAPAASSQIQCTFDYGESIKPMRSTVGNTGKELGTPLESTYGDGNVAYDPANPVGLSSGLDFRHSDDRAVVTASFDTVKDLKVELKIIGSDPRVTNPGEPRLYLGFVTNKMHHVMNAGIGGFKASSFDEPYENLKSHYKVSQWKPTHITMESCTNDDWGTNEYVCWHDVTMSQDQLFNIDSLLWVQAINKNPDLSYRVSDSRIGYEDIGPFHVTLKSDTTQIGDIQPGDIVSFGLWKGDNRTVVSRVVTNWTVATRKIEWGPELRLDEFGWKMDDLTDIGVVQVRSLVKWKNNVEKVLDYLAACNPNAHLSIATSGVPNMRCRRLEGYTPYGKSIAKARGIEFIDYYTQTREWSEQTVPDATAYLTAGGGQTSDGSAELPLYQSGGNPLQKSWTLRGWSVLVNGVERYLDGCYVIGGARRGWTNPDGDLNMGNYAWVYDQFKVVFTRDVPPAGAFVEVKYSSKQWSADDCHPSAIGYDLFGKAFNEYLRKTL